MVLTPDDPTQAQAWIRGEAPDQTVDFYIPRGNRGEMGPRGPIGPSLAVGLVETVTGPAAPGTVGPQGLTGAKGDPGGWVVSALATNTNLNAVITPGLYYPLAGTDITSANNFPVVGTGGYLEVVRWSAGSPNYVIQTYHVRGEGAANNPIGSRGFYRRVTNDAVAWSKWSFFGPQRVDQTAGRAIYAWDDINNREQLVWGDTGWRDLTPLSGTAAWVRLRRQDGLVSVWIADWANGTSADIVALPVGFGTGTNSMVAFWGLRGGSATNLIVSGPSAVIQATPSASGFSAMVTFPTIQSWPTTLPGTAHASIPNT